MRCHIQQLDWDSEWLGFPVARIVVESRNSGTALVSTIAECRSKGIKLLYIVLNPEDAAGECIVRAAGGYLADIKLAYQLRIKLPVVASTTLPVGVHLAPATEPSVQLEYLAQQSGEYSRFRRDAKIGIPAFEKLYSSWLRKVLLQGRVWVASYGGKPAGLLALTFDVPAKETHIELVAVAPEFRRHYIGQHLMQVAEQQAWDKDCNTLRVITQGENLPACSFYNKTGFRLLQTEHLYHMWL